MKTTTFLLSFFYVILFSISGLNQNVSDVFKRYSKTSWLGFDFTKAKFVGNSQDFSSIKKCKELIRLWNSLLVSEPRIFNFNEGLGYVIIGIAH